MTVAWKRGLLLGLAILLYSLGAQNYWPDLNIVSKRYKGLLFFMLSYWIICFLVFWNDLNSLYVTLAWNTFLATLPLIFINLSLLKNKVKKSIGTVIYFILWLIFFPNSVYMITDFIHISNDKLIWLDVMERYALNDGSIHSTDIMLWIKLLLIGIGVFYGLLVGLESLHLFYYYLNKKISKIFSGLIIIGISLVSGLGVYIGRFLRFNSWHLITPFTLIKEIFTSVNIFAIQFIFIFAIFILVVFVLYELISNLEPRSLDN